MVSSALSTISAQRLLEAEIHYCRTRVPAARQDSRMHESRGNIVIVEDDAGLNRAVVRLLQTAGYRSFGFDTAEGLLASTLVESADCFVLDVHLPGISGIELRARLSDAGVQRPVIFITAHDDPETRKSTSDAASCLTKPFTGRLLIQAIDAALVAATSK